MAVGRLALSVFAPIMPEAPASSSNSMCWPKEWATFSMTMRVEMSVGPPGG